METDYNSEYFQSRLHDIHSRCESVMKESKKYNILDRFFHFKIETLEIEKEIEDLNLSYDLKKVLVCETIDTVISESLHYIILDIKNCYGLWGKGIDNYLNNDKTTLIDNPVLLGISPFLFEQEEWIKVLSNDVKKSNYKSNDDYYVFTVIMTCLNDTLFRLGLNKFENLKGWQDDYLDASIMPILLWNDNDNFSNIKSKLRDKHIKDLIKDNKKNELNKIILSENLTTKNLAQILIDKLTYRLTYELEPSNQQDIKSFIYSNFRNKSNRQGTIKMFEDIPFIIKNIGAIKYDLLANLIDVNNQKVTNNVVSEILHRNFPQLSFKTIQGHETPIEK